MKLLIPILSAFLLVACNPSTENSAFDAPTEKINFTGMSEVEVENPLDSIFTSPSFVKLQIDTVNGLFTSIDILKVRNGKAFILDQGLRSLVVYDLNGRFVGKVGKRGKGADEYLQISDFDINTTGEIVILDGQADKLRNYDANFNFSSAEKMPFEADIVTFLADGNLMFGLSSWNKGKNANNKVLITDKKLNVLHHYLNFDEYHDDSYWVSLYRFTKSDSAFFYNKPIDNTVQVFSKNGKPLKSYVFDFGSMNVPDIHKKEIEKNLAEFQKYRMLTNFSVINDRVVFGKLQDRSKRRLFALDRSKNMVYLQDLTHKPAIGDMADFNQDTLISYIHPADSALFGAAPDDVKSHLTKYQFVLKIQTMN